MVVAGRWLESLVHEQIRTFVQERSKDRRLGRSDLSARVSFLVLFVLVFLLAIVPRNPSFLAPSCVALDFHVCMEMMKDSTSISTLRWIFVPLIRPSKTNGLQEDEWRHETSCRSGTRRRTSLNETRREGETCWRRSDLECFSRTVRVEGMHDWMFCERLDQNNRR